jgi:hypothetical protein
LGKALRPSLAATADTTGRFPLPIPAVLFLPATPPLKAIGGPPHTAARCRDNMLSASHVSRWRAPRVKGLRAALVLAKAARFAVLDRAAAPPVDTAPHWAKGLAIKKACCFYGDSRPALKSG